MGAGVNTIGAKLTGQKIHDVIYDALENYLGENGLTDTFLSSSEFVIRLDGDDEEITITISPIS